MIPSLQPDRPHLPVASPYNPLNQQPIRTLTTTAFPPRNQIEAMSPVPHQLAPDQSLGRVIYDASVRHPVFFTERLKRAPNGVGAGNGDGSSKGWGSPVASGYVFNDGPKREGGSRL
ncbi:hypothetical protein OIDMADRAFT_54779 [Oidiodendron maius Zn]|uniref:Uncharacterized protein n=1 Tax=Oidiodendron maius (strain Zn) TaxID=913774 RepID=A0A0C3DDZ6_OIDMZ|nr:hypothetical protein OIDMADRAFT_54779 [Oidiodendron maius Zn]